MNTRRDFIRTLAQATAVTGASVVAPSLVSQESGERPSRSSDVTILNPRARVPVGIIIDDSTCLVNLNRFAMTQFDEVHEGKAPVYKKPWRDWPAEIPDSFVRRFGEWSVSTGVKGKYSIVPYPAVVGRVDRFLPGWSQQELKQSLELVRTLMVPNWDIHPEMVTHTRVIDTRTGQPHPKCSFDYMENWNWTAGKSVDELADYVSYALGILKNAGFACEGVTSPGGFGHGALPQYSQAVLQAVRTVYAAEIPHYFRDLHDSGKESVAPRVEYASGLDGPDPRCVVSVLACTGDWTGGWDCVEPEGVDRFITQDLQHGRMVEVIERGEPAFMLAHWTGVYWNGQERGFKIFQEAVKRLQSRFQHLLWMKTSELARYWAARELTKVTREGNVLAFKAPFACPYFTVQVRAAKRSAPSLRVGPEVRALREVSVPAHLESATWCHSEGNLQLCFPLPKGASTIDLNA
jgi:hypothetical protein